ncbi:MAG: acylphosphatase [Flavisolibacter sp.]|jgi:acylphosphatase
MPTIHLIVKGKVQGVFYRASAKDMAMKLGLKGWVKNTKEGDVEMKVQGPEDLLEEFIHWCHKGPPSAQVTSIEQHELAEESFHDFRIKKDSFL